MAARSRIGPWQRGHSNTSSSQERFSYCISCSRSDIWCFFGPTIGHWVRQPVQPLAVVIADARLEFSLEAKLADRRAAESELGGDLFHGSHPASSKRSLRLLIFAE